MPIQTAIDSINNNQGSPFGFKNRIINGTMVIDQRNAGAANTPVNAVSTYTLDRWSFYVSQANKLTTQQSTTAPTGFINSLLVTSSSSFSPIGATDQFELRQFIEGLNVADFGWGTVNAQPVTLSFWVYSSLGPCTFGGVIRNSASDRSYAFSYTISASNTWEQKTITIPGDTSGTWLTTNGRGIGVFFSLGAGTTYLKAAGSWGAGEFSGATTQTNLVSTSGATFYITGVQLEKGRAASSFDYRDYGRELIMCQRYFQLVHPTAGNATTSTVADMIVSCFTPMRANATLNQNGVLTVYDDQVGPFTQSSTSIVNLGNQNNVVNTIRLSNFSGMTANRFLIGSPGNPSNYVSLSAEL